MGGHSSVELPVAISVYGGGAGILMRIIQIEIVTLDTDRKALYAHFKPVRRTWIFTNSRPPHQNLRGPSCNGFIRLFPLYFNAWLIKLLRSKEEGSLFRTPGRLHLI